MDEPSVAFAPVIITISYNDTPLQHVTKNIVFHDTQLLDHPNFNPKQSLNIGSTHSRTITEHIERN